MRSWQRLLSHLSFMASRDVQLKCIRHVNVDAIHIDVRSPKLKSYPSREEAPK